MIRSFEELLAAAKNMKQQTVSVAVAQDADVLRAVDRAYEEGIIRAILVGCKEEIMSIAANENIDAGRFEIIDEKDETEACRIAVEKVTNGEADMILKGLVHTSIILKAVLNKEANLRTGRLLSHVGVMDVPQYHKLITVTDGGMNIAPSLEEKKQIIENAVLVSKSLGIDVPKVAVVGAKEDVNPKMPATLDAKELEDMNKRGEIEGCLVEGPFALDNAVSAAAARQKGIDKKVAGDADIILVPDIEGGNLLCKALVFLGDAVPAGIIVGAKAPVIVTSRADSDVSKLYSIALAMFVAQHSGNK